MWPNEQIMHEAIIKSWFDSLKFVQKRVFKFNLKKMLYSVTKQEESQQNDNKMIKNFDLVLNITKRTNKVEIECISCL